MILTKINKPLSSLFLLLLITTGCSQHSPRELELSETLDKAKQKTSESTAMFQLDMQKEDKKIIVKKDPNGANSIWERLFALYALPKVEHPRVDEEIKNFLRYPKLLVQVQKRAEPYLGLILDEIEAKKLPGELALLPIIESSFNAKAVSPARASGLWQFTSDTADTFGLKRDTWYDGRLDVYASTQAATRYFKRLGERFDGDWLLALASYNLGAKTVEKAVEENENNDLDTQFWSLSLPKETMEFVPKLLALAEIFANADKYNLTLKDIPAEPVVKVVKAPAQLDFDVAAELAGMDADEFRGLNPAFKHAITSPEGEHQILVKAENADDFKEKLAQLPQRDPIKWTEYKIKALEKLEAVSEKTAVTRVERKDTSKKDIVTLNIASKEKSGKDKKTGVMLTTLAKKDVRSKTKTASEAKNSSNKKSAVNQIASASLSKSISKDKKVSALLKTAAKKDNAKVLAKNDSVTNKKLAAAKATRIPTNLKKSTKKNS